MNESTSTGRSASGRTVIRFSGSLQADNEDLTCRCCGTKMHVNNHPGITLRHLPFGGYLSDAELSDEEHRAKITKAAEDIIEDMRVTQMYTHSLHLRWPQTACRTF